MLPIEAFLARARQLLGAAAASKSEIVAVINSVCGAKLEHAMIEVKGKTVSIKAHPAIKSVIYMKKTTIIETLKRNGIDIIDIR